MGLTYSSIIVKTDDSDNVITAAKAKAKVPVWISPPSKGFVCVFSSNIEDSALAKALSSELRCSVLHALAASEDLFRYTVYTKGKSVDCLDSCPDYPLAEQPPIHGNASKLCAAFGCEKRIAKVQPILSTEYVFPSQKLSDLIKSLGMPDWMAGSYRYLSELRDEHKNIYALGCHFDPVDRKPAKQTAAEKVREALIIVQPSGFDSQTMKPIYRDLSGEPTSITIGIGKSKAILVYVVNTGIHSRGLDVEISGSAVKSDLIKPTINTQTGSSAIQPAATLHRTSDKNWFCAIPKKEIREAFFLELKLRGLKGGKGDIKVEVKKHSPRNAKPGLWLLNLEIGGPRARASTARKGK